MWIVTAEWFEKAGNQFLLQGFCEVHTLQWLSFKMCKWAWQGFSHRRDTGHAQANQKPKPAGSGQAIGRFFLKNHSHINFSL